MPRSRFILQTRLLWLRVRVHWTLLMAIPVFWYLGRGVWEALFGLTAWVTLLFAHECGHAIVARRLGLRVHAIYLYPVHGTCEYDAARFELDEVLVSWGGVAAQSLLLLLPAFAAALSWLLGAPLSSVARLALTVLGPINLVMIATNLLPLRGLDGALAWRVFPLLRGQWRGALSRVLARSRRRARVAPRSAQVLTAEVIERAKRRAKQLD